MRHSRDPFSILRHFTLGAALAVALTGSLAAHAETINVPCDPLALPSVMIKVNTNAEEDVVSLAPSCVYVMPASWVVEEDSGNPLRIYGNGATLSGNDQRTVFLVDPVATLHLSDLTVTKGKASIINGGGIQNLGNLTLTDCTVSSSSAPEGYGGGIHNVGRLRLVRSTVSENTSAVQAGGINNAVGGRLTITDSTLSGNSALYGGGINNAGRAAVYNSTFIGNNGFIGGGILNDKGGRASLSNVTISGSAISGSGGGGGIRNEGMLDIDNSIVANTSLGGGDCFNDGTMTNSSGNLIEDGSCGLVGTTTGDPKLGAPTGTPAVLPLLEGSPAIDLGQNPHCPGADQRGAPRPQDGNGDGFVICDLGAFELSADADGDGVPSTGDNCLSASNPDQRDTNADGFGNACDADFNQDDVVNAVDLGRLKSLFFSTDADTDLNGDGVVNAADLANLKSRFFKPPGPSGLGCAGTIPCP
jgi:hypothetical protein